MHTVTITSQGQVTIPAAIRRAWRIKGSEELVVSFNAETRQVTLQKPLTVEEFLDIAAAVTAKIPKHIRPLQNGDIHEFYALEKSAGYSKEQQT